MVLVGTVVVYPALALSLIAALSAYPAKWGPIVLFLMGIGGELLLLLELLLMLLSKLLLLFAMLLS